MPTSILFLPGTMCTELLWADCLPHLSDTISYKHAAIYQAENKAEMHEYVAAELETPTHLIGFSLGAYLAMEHVIKFPAQSVKSLVLIAGSARGLFDDEIKSRETILKWIEKNNYKGINQSRLKQLLSEDSLQSEAIVQKIQQMDKELGKEVLITQFQATTYREDLMEKLATISVPVLLLGAENDGIVSVQALQQMADIIPNATLAIEPNSGHMLPLESAEWVAHQINLWLK